MKHNAYRIDHSCWRCVGDRNCFSLALARELGITVPVFDREATPTVVSEVITPFNVLVGIVDPTAVPDGVVSISGDRRA